MMTWTDFSEKILNALLRAGQVVAEYGGALLLALIILGAGIYVSRLVIIFSEKFFRLIKLDDKCSRIGVTDLMAKMGFGKRPSYGLSFIMAWVVVLVSVFYAAAVLHLTDIQTLILKFLNLVPSIIVAFFILAAGLWLGKITATIFENFMKEHKLPGGRLAARATNGFIILFAVLLALNSLGIDMKLVNFLVMIVICSLGLAFAIAFGLGARPVVEEKLREFLNKEDK